MSGAPISGDYIKAEGKAGRMGARLMAIVAEGDRERVYLAPTSSHESVTSGVDPRWRPEINISGSTQYLGVKPYGMERFDQLFTNRQLIALDTICDLVQEVRSCVAKDAKTFALANKEYSNSKLGDFSAAYGDAVGTYLAFALSKLLDRCCTLVTWFPERDSTYHVFGRQALPMTWDYAETNVLAAGSGSYSNAVSWEAEVVENFSASTAGFATQVGAQLQVTSMAKVVSTDPPYYDNVPYADLSDFFYVWLRRSLKDLYPELFATVAVPKADELVAFAHRHDGKHSAEAFFLHGMTDAMHRLAEQSHPAFPVTIYYAFKQSEGDSLSGTVSTGWETFLDAVLAAGFTIGGTWPVRTELTNRLRNIGLERPCFEHCLSLS